MLVNSVSKMWSNKDIFGFHPRFMLKDTRFVAVLFDLGVASKPFGSIRAANGHARQRLDNQFIIPVILIA